MKDFFAHNASIIISIFSLLLSAVSLFFTYRVNKLDYKLKKAKVKELDEKFIEENTCAIDASFVPVGSNKVKIKVFNNHGLDAYNISVSIEDKLGIYIHSDVLPYEKLKPRESFDINVLTHDFSRRKANIHLEWDDANGNHYSDDVLSSY